MFSGREEPVVETLETLVEIPFRVAALGGKVPVTLPVNETCRECGGSGAAKGALPSSCRELWLAQAYALTGAPMATAWLPPCVSWALSVPEPPST